MKLRQLVMLVLLVVFVLSAVFPAAAAPHMDSLSAQKTCVYLVFYQVDTGGWFGSGIIARIERFPADADNICRFSDQSKVLRVKIIGYMALRG